MPKWRILCCIVLLVGGFQRLLLGFSLRHSYRSARDSSASFDARRLCHSRHEVDTSCGAPLHRRWYYDQYTGVCKIYRTCTIPTRIYSNDFTSITKCQGLCVLRDVQCPPLAPLRNGTKFVKGDVAHYACSRGYTLVGPSQRFCHSNGTWSGVNPYCARLEIRSQGKELQTTSVLLLSSGQNKVSLDCWVHSQFSNVTTPVWIYYKDPQYSSAPYPWGVYTTVSRTNYTVSVSLTISRVDSEHNGFYLCRAGTLEKSVRVKVQAVGHYQPVVVQEPPDHFGRDSMTVVCGASIEFYCIFRGSPRPNITWLHNGSRVAPSGPVSIRLSSHTLSTNEEYLILSFIKFSSIFVSQDGVFTCLASNTQGSIQSRGLAITVPCVGQHHSKDRPNPVITCTTSEFGAVALLEEELSEDLFSIRIQEVVKSPSNFTSTVMRVRVTRGSCSCDVRLKHSYLFLGSLGGDTDGVVLTGTNRTVLWDTATVNVTDIRQSCGGVLH